MSHNTSLALMGSTQSSYRVVTNHKGVIDAGLCVRLKSDDTIVLTKADGPIPLGISLGKDLSDIGFTSICNKGIKVPVKLGTGFNPVIGAIVNISDTTGEAVASGAGATAVNAVYESERIGGSGATGGIVEFASTETGTIGVAYISFPGGL